MPNFRDCNIDNEYELEKVREKARLCARKEYEDEKKAESGKHRVLKVLYSKEVVGGIGALILLYDIYTTLF